MDNSGRLNFGLQPHATRPGPLVIPTFTARPAVTTPAGYANNAWHHAVATFQPTGARIYVDGNLAAEDPTMTWTMPINAYLRLGADYVQFFPNKPSSDWFAGTLDEVATYNYPLSGRAGEGSLGRRVPDADRPGSVDAGGLPSAASART